MFREVMAAPNQAESRGVSGGLSFELLGIPVQVNLFFLLIAAWFGTQLAGKGDDWLLRLGLFMLVMFLGVLFHELGHALAGRSFGLQPQIELHGLGGVTSWRGGRALTPGRSMWVSFAGPLVGIVVGLAALYVLIFITEQPGAFLPFPSLDRLGGLMQAATFAKEVVPYVLAIAVWVNLGWGILNLLPMLPLDGGNIVASFFERFAPFRGRLIARYLSLGVLLLVIAYLFATGSGLLSAWNLIILGLIGFSNFRGLKQDRQIAEDGPVLPLLRKAGAAFRDQDGPRLVAAAEQIAKDGRSERVRAEGMRLLAWGQLLSDDPRAAQRTINESGGQADPELQGAVLLALGSPEDAAKHLERAVADGAGATAGGLLAEAYLASGGFDRAAAFFRSGDGDNAHPDAVFAVEEGAFDAGRFEVAAELGAILFEREGRAIRAFNVACSLSRGGRIEESLEWIERARVAGLEDPSILDTDPDLEAVRAHPDFTKLRARF